MGNMQSFKEHLAEQEELNELFGSIPFIINTIKYYSKNREEPKGESTWRFKFVVPESRTHRTGIHANEEGVFEYKGTYKKALKALIGHMKARGGNVKQAKVDLLA